MAKDTLNPFTLIRIFSILKKEAPDICYFISAHPLNPVAILLIQALEKTMGRKIRVVSHIHDIFPHKNTKNAFFIDFFQKWQIRLSGKITVYGENLKKQILERFKLNPKKVLAVPHGVNRVKLEGREFLPNANERKFISFVGRIDEYKGIDIFLEVAKHFERKNGPIFFLGGKGDLSPYRNKIRGLSNLCVEN